jgi:flagellar biogenesis protein FliO
MNDVNFGDLVGRMAISLLVVLGLMLVVYRVIKHRQRSSFGPSPKSPRSGLLQRGVGLRRMGSSRAANAKRGLKVVGRVGLSRTTSVIAVQFAEKVYMLGTSEQGPPAVLAEIEAEAWATSTEAGEELVPIIRSATAFRDQPAARPGLIDALRQATARRG